MMTSARLAALAVPLILGVGLLSGGLAHDTAAATPPGQAAFPQCRHDANELVDEQARRRDALTAARAINTLQANQPGARAGRFLDLAGLATAAAARPPVVRTQLLFVPGAELMPGFELKLSVTNGGYWFLITDTTDPCGFTYISNERGVIYRSEPIR